MKKLKLFFACLLMAVLSIGQVWATEETKTEGFETKTASTSYNSTVTVTTAESDCGIGWTIYYGTVSTNDKISGSNSAQMRYYSSSDSRGYVQSTTPVDGLSNVAFKARVSSTNIQMTVSYSADASTWTALATNETFSETGKGIAFNYDVPSGGKYIKIEIGDGSTKPSSGNIKFIIDDVVFTYETGSSTPTCATPTFLPAAGSYEGTQNVTISSTEGATIYYTTDGSDPSASSSVYSSPIAVSASQTIKAYAVKADYEDSEVAEAAYVITEGPDVTLDLVDGNWGFPTSNTTGTETYTNSVTGYSVTCYAPTNYKVSGSSYFYLGKSGAYIELPSFSSPIEKIVVTGNSGASTGVIWNIFKGDDAVSTAATGCAESSYTFNIDPEEANVTYTLKVTSAHNLQIKAIKIFFGEAPAVATPTISGATPFATTTTVTLGCTTDGALIYYTTDGTDPTSSSSLYENPFELNASATVKAIAILSSDQSSIASKEFEKVTSYTTLADIFTKAEEVSSTATDIYVTFDGWKVSAKTNNNAFLTDGTNGAVIYGNGHGFNAGDVLTGTAACKVQLYKGFAELTALTSGTTGLTVTPGSVGDPVVKTWEQLSAVNTGALVKLENLTYDGSSLSDGVNTIPTYTTFYTATFEAGKSYNLTGVYQYYDTDGQILPRSAADVEEIVETFTVTYDNAPEHGTLTIKNGDDVVTSGSAVNEGTVLTIVTSPAEDYKLDGVTVNGSAYAESTLTLTANVTIAATFVVNEAPLVETYVLSEIGVETSHLVSGEHVGDKVNLPLTATECSKTFRGWSANASCAVAPEYAPGAEITLAANNKFYAVYADAHVVTPTDHALGSVTIGGTSGNTPSEGYTFSKSTKGDNKTGYIQDSGTKDETIIFVQIKAESQIINEEPSAIIVTAHLAAGSDKDPLGYPVYAVLVDADGNNVGDPVALATAVPKAGDDFSANLPTANYANVRGVKISHMKEDGWNVRYHSMSFKYQTGGTSYDNYSTDCQAQVATPVISGVTADGVYTEGKEISITCATAGATIYYAVDSDEEPSTEYTGAFTVGTAGAHTVKAKAVKTDMVASDIASVSFTINLPLSTMDQIFAAATAAGSTATDANITFGNWVVSGVSTNGKNVFVTDGTKGFIIFDNGGEMGFAVGDVLSGTVACKVQLYKGAAELTTLSSATEGLNIATGGSVAPQVKAINALSGINTGAPVIINSVQFDGEYLTDGANSIKPFNSLFAYDALENGNYYNVTGIYQQFDATKEILPRSADDIEEVSLADPEIGYTPASATIELGEDLPGTVFANPHELAISYSSNNEAVATVSNAGVIALGSATGTAVITASFAGDATYAAANVTYTITVNPASVSENVVILAVYDTKYYAMSTNNASSAFTAIAVEYDGTQVTVNSAEDKAAIQWTKKTSGDNTTFQDADSKYMKSADGTSMSLQEAVCNWVWDATGEYYKISGTSRTFFYQSGTGFKNFATSNFNKTGYSDKAQVIAIAAENIVITSKVSAELAYDPESDEITQGDAWSAPSLVNPHSVTITSYNSDNEAVATVTDGGVIALAGGIGTAVITAHFDGDASYLEGDAVYTITVNAPAPTPSGTSYVKVTSTADITADGEYLLVNENALKAFNGNLETLDAEGNTVDVVISGGKIAGTSAIDAAIFTIDASNGNLRSHSGHYVGVGGYSNGLAQSDEAGTYANVFAINASENVDITITFTGGDMHLLYNTANRFRYYKAENQTNKAIQLYKKESSTPEPPTPVYETVRGDLTAGNYYTVCYNKTMNEIRGASLWQFLNKDASYAYIVEAEAPYVAGTPYLIYAESDKLEAVVEEVASPVAGHHNGLYGTLSYMDAVALSVAGADYMLKNNEIRPIGSNNHLDANRAYIKIGEIPAVSVLAPGKKVRKMPMQSQTTTGCELINAAEAPAKMMINGQLFILRGEKMYDTTGRLVK